MKTLTKAELVALRDSQPWPQWLIDSLNAAIKLLSLVLVISLSACGGQFKSDPAVMHTFTKFVDEAAARGKTYSYSNLSITLDKRPGTEPGRCTHLWKVFGGHHHISLDKERFLNTTDSDRELMLFHEMGHCVLNKGHLKFPNRGVMQAELDDGGYYMNRETWLDDLFK